jgi:hypothetical protein
MQVRHGMPSGASFGWHRANDRVAEIHRRFAYRMHNLSDFMKTLLQRFTRWFNRTHERSGTAVELERPSAESLSVSFPNHGISE